MSLHVYRAHLASTRAEHELRMYVMAEDKRASALRVGRNARRPRSTARRLRYAAAAMREAERHWTAALVDLLTWGLR